MIMVRFGWKPAMEQPLQWPTTEPFRPDPALLLGQATGLAEGWDG